MKEETKSADKRSGNHSLRTERQITKNSCSPTDTSIEEKGRTENARDKKGKKEKAASVEDFHRSEKENSLQL